MRNRLPFSNTQNFISADKLFSAVKFILVLITSFHVSVSAEQAPESFQQCIACHGKQGIGNKVLGAPAIAGQSANYIQRQLTHFASGIRGEHNNDTFGKQMIAISKPLDINKDVPALSQYIASLPAAKQEKTVSGDLMNGSRYYQAKCGACHGGQAQGNPSFKAPNLATLAPWYIQRQMDNFQQGIRGTHADDKLGRQMAMMAKTVSDKELSDIIFYINQQ